MSSKFSDWCEEESRLNDVEKNDYVSGSWNVNLDVICPEVEVVPQIMSSPPVKSAISNVSPLKDISHSPQGIGSSKSIVLSKRMKMAVDVKQKMVNMVSKKVVPMVNRIRS